MQSVVLQIKLLFLSMYKRTGILHLQAKYHVVQKASSPLGLPPVLSTLPFFTPDLPVNCCFWRESPTKLWSPFWQLCGFAGLKQHRVFLYHTSTIKMQTQNEYLMLWGSKGPATQSSLFQRKHLCAKNVSAMAPFLLLGGVTGLSHNFLLSSVAVE